MEVNIVEDKQSELIVEFDGVDRGILELIKERVLEEKGVDFATVAKEHPLVGRPKLIVRSSKNAKKIVENAVEEMEGEVKELSSKLKK